MKKYLTPKRGLILPGLCNGDGHVLPFLRKDRVKRLWNTFWLPNSQLLQPLRQEFGLNIWSLSRRKSLGQEYDSDCINMLAKRFIGKASIHGQESARELDSWVIGDENWQDLKGDEERFYMITFYSPIDNGYIGTPDRALMLYNKGIMPQKAEKDDHSALIGFCETEQKWYGWARAMYGFEVGSIVKKGDIAYTPSNRKDFIEDAVRFWSDPEHKNVHADPISNFDEDGKEFYMIQWEVEGENQIAGASVYVPNQWGRGEWTAESLDDAKQMAIDFVEGCA